MSIGGRQLRFLLAVMTVAAAVNGCSSCGHDDLEPTPQVVVAPQPIVQIDGANNIGNNTQPQIPPNFRMHSPTGYGWPPMHFADAGTP
jgi:hypothetical protein